MAGYATLRDAIVTQLETVDDIGPVHNYRRLVQDSATSREAFSEPVAGSDARYVRFADVDLTSGRLEPIGWGDGTDYLMGGPLRFTCRLFRGLQDGEASGRSFAAMVEDALRAVSQCMTATTPRWERVAVQLIEHSHRQFAFPGLGEPVCHYAEILVECPDEVRY